MTRHTITEEELDEWMTDRWHHFAGSYGGDTNKCFLVDPSAGRYQVINDCMVIYEGDDKATAIRYYNKAQ